MEAYTDTITDKLGNSINAATVSVYSGASLATIYSDDGVTPKSNPFASTAIGLVQFYAANGRYDVVVSHPDYNGGVAVTVPVVLNDLTTIVEEAAASADADRIAAEAAAAIAILGTGIGAVATIADLRNTAGSYDGQLVQVSGYYAPGDGGGGPVRRWDAASVADDDGGACIDPTVAGAGRWVFTEKVINPLSYGAKGDGVTDNTGVFANALAALPQGGVLDISPGTWVGNLITPTNGIKIKGAKIPTYNPSTGRLEGGTIIVGYIDLNYTVGSSVEDLGVDTTDALSAEDAAVTSGLSGVGYVGQTFKNLALLGRGYSGPDAPANSAHGLKLEGGSHVTVDNVKVYKFGHGIAVKSSFSNISNIYVEDTLYDALIVKSDAAHPLVENININNITAKTVDGGSSEIYVQALVSGSITRNVNINNFSSYNSATVGLQTYGDVDTTLSDINLSNILVSNPGTNGIEVGYRSTDVYLTNVQVSNAGEHSFKNWTADYVSILNGKSASPVIADTSGRFSGFYITDSGGFAKVVSNINAVSDTQGMTDESQLSITANTAQRVIGSGAALGFKVPTANDETVTLEEQGRILVSPDNITNSDATGRMYLQTRYYEGLLTAWTWKTHLRLGKHINLPSVQERADNAAALAAGLVVGDVYRTATGQLMIVY